MYLEYQVSFLYEAQVKYDHVKDMSIMQLKWKPTATPNYANRRTSYRWNWDVDLSDMLELESNTRPISCWDEKCNALKTLQWRK